MTLLRAERLDHLGSSAASPDGEPRTLTTGSTGKVRFTVRNATEEPRARRRGDGDTPGGGDAGL